MKAKKQSFIYICLILLLCCAQSIGQPLVRSRHYSVRDGLSSGVVNTIVQDKTGYLWLGTNLGLTRFDGYHFINFYYDIEGHRQMKNVVGIAEDAQHVRLLLDVSGSQPLCFSLAHMRFVPSGTVRFSIDRRPQEQAYSRLKALGVTPHNMTGRRVYVHAATMDDGTEVFGTTEDGLYIHKKGELRVEHYTASSASSLLETNYVNDVMKDASGTLWIATTYGGICQLIANDFGQQWHTPQGADAPAGANSVRALCQADGNTVAVAAMDGTVYSYNLDTQQWQRLFRKAFRTYSMAVDGRGRLWAGTRGGGVWVNDRCLNETDGLRARQIYDIAMAPDGTVWLGTLDGGLVKAVEKADGHFAFTTYMKGEAVRELSVGRGGIIWVATSDGVYKVKRGRVFKVAALENVICISHDSKGTVWVGTIGHGLVRIDADGHRTAMTTDEGLVDNSVKCVDVVDDSTIVIGTDGGASIISTHNGNSRDYTCRSVYSPLGAMGDVYNENAILHTRDGRVLIGCANGFVELRALHGRVSGHRHANVPHITCIEVNGKPVFPDAAKVLRLDHRQGNLKIFFSSFDYRDLASVTYSFWLEGADKGWRASVRDNMALYGNLPPGHYKFHLRSHCPAKGWSKEEVFDIDIAQPWWWTWWARTAYLLLACLLMGYEWRQYQQRLSLRRQLDSRLTTLYSATSMEKTDAEQADENEPKNDGCVLSDEPEPDNVRKQVDREFLDKLDRIILAHLQDESLDVNFLARELCMSYSTLHRRMKALTGMTANGYVRKHRLAKAMQLLRSGHSVTEVSAMCGFNTPSYFTRCFKSEYGVLPSEV